MSDKEHWVKLSNQVCKIHNAIGSCAVRLDDGMPADLYEKALVNIDGDPLQVDGQELLPSKHIRKYLHSQRQRSAYKKENAVVWTAYVEATDKSIVSLGLLVDPKVAARVEKSNSESLAWAWAGDE